MGSKPRNIEPGYVDHVLNRGAERRRLFFSDEDYIRFEDLIERVNQPLTEAEMAAVRHSIRRGRPLGTPEWTRGTAELLGLRHTLRQQVRSSIISCR